MSEPAGSFAGRTDAEDATFLDLRDYGAVLWSGKWTIAAVTVIVVILGAIAATVWPSRYESTATILLPSPDDTDGSEGTEEALALSFPVIGLAADRLASTTASQVLARVSAEVAANTRLLQITYSTDEPEEARRGAQAMAQAYLDYRNRLATETAGNEIERQIVILNDTLAGLSQELTGAIPAPRRLVLEARVQALAGQVAELEGQLALIQARGASSIGTIVGAPVLPRSATGPGTAATALASLLAGLVLGGIVAFVRERTGDRLRNAADLELAAGAPVLAVIPPIPVSEDGKRPSLVALTAPGSPGSEAYRTLGASLATVAAQRRLATLLVTSASAAENRSALVSNVGVLMAQTGSRVIIVSADFHHPELHRYFGIANRAGLSNVLAGKRRPATVLSKTKVPGLLVMPSGPPPKVPGDVLGSPVMGQLLAELDASSDLILIDAPPILVGADAVVLAARVDGVLMVAKVDASKRGAVTLARQRLDQVDAPLVGTVLTEARSRTPQGLPAE